MHKAGVTTGFDVGLENLGSFWADWIVRKVLEFVLVVIFQPGTCIAFQGRCGSSLPVLKNKI